jgi:glycosyltransferase involved in cell wall biosynthesis
MTPISVPLYTPKVLRRMNAALVRIQVAAVVRLLSMYDPVIVATLPTAWDVVQPMRRKALLYNRSDRHSEFPGVDHVAIASMEKSMLAESDHVLYVSRALLEEERVLAGERAYFLDHGVDVDHFRWTEKLSQPADILAIPGPRLGFFGALDDFLVDFDLLERLARDLPDTSLVLIGYAPDSMDRFASYSNVYYLGFRPYDLIPAYGSAFDVALMPWVDSPWIQACNPIKLKEYLALGLPVVSTPYAEVQFYADHVRVAENHDKFIAEVQRTINDGGPSSSEDRRAAVLGYSWKSRAECLRRLAESPARE